MREFNLEQALAGHPVCTRDGREVTQLTQFNIASDYSLAGVIEGYLYQWKPDGKYISSLGDNPRDLFMAPSKKTGWVARYSYSKADRSYIGGFIFDSEEGAKAGEPDAISYHQIELDE